MSRERGDGGCNALQNLGGLAGGISVLGSAAGGFEADFGFEPNCNECTNLEATSSKKKGEGALESCNYGIRYLKTVFCLIRVRKF